MFHFIHFQQIIALVDFQYQIPQVVTGVHAKQFDFILKQSMHMKSAYSDESEACYCFMKSIHVHTFVVDNDHLRFFQMSGDCQPLPRELQQQTKIRYVTDRSQLSYPFAFPQSLVLIENNFHERFLLSGVDDIRIPVAFGRIFFVENN